MAGGGQGLFTKRALPLGSFIGFYCGEEMEGKRANAALSKHNGAYAMEIAPGVVFSARPGTTAKDLLAFVNEPPEKEEANVRIVPYYLNAEKHPDRPVAVAMAFYVSRPVTANAELWVHYGPKYQPIRKRLGYKAGRAAPILPPESLEEPQRVMPYLPLDCFVALEKTRRTKAKVQGEGRPRGRPPKGKMWDSNQRKFVALEKESRAKSKVRGKGRPRGRPPKGKTWDSNRKEYVYGT